MRMEDLATTELIGRSFQLAIYMRKLNDKRNGYTR